MKQNLFQFFLPQEAGGFGKSIEKEQRKLPKNGKNVNIIYLQRIFALFVIQCN